MTNSGKLVVLDKLLRRLKAEGHRVLVFCTMVRMIQILEDYFILRGYEFCVLDGSTSTQERERMMSDFNRPPTRAEPAPRRVAASRCVASLHRGSLARLQPKLVQVCVRAVDARRRTGHQPIHGGHGARPPVHLPVMAVASS